MAAERPLGGHRPIGYASDFAGDYGVHDFDISPDGRYIGVEQVQELSDIVLIELARR